MTPERELITRLLHESNQGNRQALDQLMPLVYDQLHKLAGNCMRSERPDHTLRATALVHEAYLRLVGSDIAWQDRTHFYAVAARTLRRILVDHAKARKREKRGAGAERITFDESVLVSPDGTGGIIEINDALDRLAKVDQRKSDIIEMLFFGGLTYDEASSALGISPATLHRELTLAKAWLYREVAPASRSAEAPGS
jgi:RNA polymerase sigma factor (TIGR02999 family)